MPEEPSLPPGLSRAAQNDGAADRCERCHVARVFMWPDISLGLVNDGARKMCLGLVNLSCFGARRQHDVAQTLKRWKECFSPNP